jgi:excisionase family DNA binding protein
MTDTTMAPIKPIVVSIDEAARIMNTSRSEVYQGIARGELAAVKDGARTKITMDSIERRMSSLPRLQVKEYIPRQRRRRPASTPADRP